MEFEWDEAKRQSNLLKHGLDFRRADVVLDGRTSEQQVRPGPSGESRWSVTGVLDDQFVTIIFTLRQNVVRLISMRRARRDERSRYQAPYLN